MRIAVEAPSDFAAKYDELLGPCAVEFRVGGCFASLCCPQGGAVDIGSAWLWLPRAHQWRYQCRIAAQHGAVGRRSVAASVIRPCCEADKSPGLLRSRVRFRGRQANVHDEYLRARPQPRLLRALLGPWHCRLGFGCWLSCFPAIIAGGGLLTQVAAAGPGFSLNLGGGGQGTLALLTCVQHVSLQACQYRLDLMP